ncbi:hypothetical protein I6F30_25440 [Bradyrhizobium sp. NBAIM20]|uniref:hypothetical protein n=1 Tax=unclassified Bradyrhizobium TaxID=2631580 RepID=UPI001CD1D2C1|nr:MULTISPECIES: hypothetical protein [unclassified Bradyrhizobium]MCA1414470.1 hypothetical protein [Bradyrhizobium sp. NBAIM20]MCA1459868.1 hypothetical protein [Bradyrhizobium sp. NBAIM18]
MSGPAKTTATVVDLVEVLRELADSKAYRYAHHQIELPDAADELQHFADRTGLAADQDLVQRVIAVPFAWVRALNDNERPGAIEPEQVAPFDDARQLVRAWELEDPRDRWKHTGELPPAPAEKPKTPNVYKPDDSTIDAFFYLVRLGDPERLRAWLDDHRRDAPHLLELLKATQ